MAHHKLCARNRIFYFVFCFLLFQLNKWLLFLANAFYRMEGVITCWLNVFCLFFVFVVFMRKYVICNNINLMKDYYVLFFSSLACVEENDRDVILSSLVIQNTHNQNNSNCNI